MSINYEQLLIENRKSFREALRRQRKANKILREENERLQALCFVKDDEVTAPVNQEEEKRIRKVLDDVFTYGRKEDVDKAVADILKLIDK